MILHIRRRYWQLNDSLYGGVRGFKVVISNMQAAPETKMDQRILEAFAHGFTNGGRDGGKNSWRALSIATHSSVFQSFRLCAVLQHLLRLYASQGDWPSMLKALKFMRPLKHKLHGVSRS
jgi:hypothetical protein